jgi:hypothetical protein
MSSYFCNGCKPILTRLCVNMLIVINHILLYFFMFCHSLTFFGFHFMDIVNMMHLDHRTMEKKLVFSPSLSQCTLDFFMSQGFHLGIHFFQLLFDICLFLF